MTHPAGGWREYPRTLHQWQDQTLTVRTDEEKAAAIEAGWSLTPVQEAPVVPEPVESDDAPRRAGRKRQAVN